MRFQKRIKLLPGMTLNLSKSGVTTTLGVPGARVNLGGKRRPLVTVGLPGTGISHTQAVGSAPASGGSGAAGGVPRPQQAAAAAKSPWRWVFYIAVFIAWMLLLRK